jgi:hypothetical protein
MPIYFAYGSNMSTRRLQARVSAARPIGAAVLARHRMGFFKLDGDGSGKCTIDHTAAAGDAVHGMLYELPPPAKEALDVAEGGYLSRSVLVNVGGRFLSAFTYVATELHLDPHPMPYTWYKDFVLAGADEHRLPAVYVDSIRAVPTATDPDARRAERNQAILRGF